MVDESHIIVIVVLILILLSFILPLVLSTYNREYDLYQLVDHRFEKTKNEFGNIEKLQKDAISTTALLSTSISALTSAALSKALSPTCPEKSGLTTATATTTMTAATATTTMTSPHASAATANVQPTNATTTAPTETTTATTTRRTMTMTTSPTTTPTKHGKVDTSDKSTGVDRDMDYEDGDSEGDDLTINTTKLNFPAARRSIPEVENPSILMSYRFFPNSTNIHADWMTNNISLGYMCNDIKRGLQYGYHNPHSKDANLYKAVAEDFIYQYNKVLPKKLPDEAIPWGNNWYEFSVTSTCMLAYYLLMPNASMREMACKLILRLISNPRKSLGFARDQSNTLYLVGPWILAMYYTNQLDRAIETPEYKYALKMTKMELQVQANGNGLHKDMTFIAHDKIIAPKYLTNTLSDLSHYYYFLDPRASKKLQRYCDMLSSIIYHQSVPIGIPGFDGRQLDLRSTVNKKSPNGIRVMPFGKVIRYHTSNYQFAVKAQTKGLGYYEADKTAFATAQFWVQYRNMHSRDSKFDMNWPQPGFINPFAAQKLIELPSKTETTYIYNPKEARSFVATYENIGLLRQWYRIEEFGNYSVYEFIVIDSNDGTVVIYISIDNTASTESLVYHGSDMKQEYIAAHTRCVFKSGCNLRKGITMPCKRVVNMPTMPYKPVNSDLVFSDLDEHHMILSKKNVPKVCAINLMTSGYEGNHIGLTINNELVVFSFDSKLNQYVNDNKPVYVCVPKMSTIVGVLIVILILLLLFVGTLHFITKIGNITKNLYINQYDEAATAATAAATATSTDGKRPANAEAVAAAAGAAAMMTDDEPTDSSDVKESVIGTTVTDVMNNNMRPPTSEFANNMLTVSEALKTLPKIEKSPAELNAPNFETDTEWRTNEKALAKHCDALRLGLLYAYRNPNSEISKRNVKLVENFIGEYEIALHKSIAYDPQNGFLSIPWGTVWYTFGLNSTSLLMYYILIANEKTYSPRAADIILSIISNPRLAMGTVRTGLNAMNLAAPWLVAKHYKNETDTALMSTEYKTTVSEMQLTTKTEPLQAGLHRDLSYYGSNRLLNFGMLRRMKNDLINALVAMEPRLVVRPADIWDKIDAIISHPSIPRGVLGVNFNLSGTVSLDCETNPRAPYGIRVMPLSSYIRYFEKKTQFAIKGVRGNSPFYEYDANYDTFAASQYHVQYRNLHYENDNVTADLVYPNVGFLNRANTRELVRMPSVKPSSANDQAPNSRLPTVGKKVTPLPNLARSFVMKYKNIGIFYQEYAIQWFGSCRVHELSIMYDEQNRITTHVHAHNFEETKIVYYGVHKTAHDVNPKSEETFVTRFDCRYPTTSETHIGNDTDKNFYKYPLVIGDGIQVILVKDNFNVLLDNQEPKVCCPFDFRAETQEITVTVLDKARLFRFDSEENQWII